MRIGHPRRSVFWANMAGGMGDGQDAAKHPLEIVWLTAH
jgi:hypothetical protein